MNHEIITRITRIEKRRLPRKLKAGKTLSQPYWYGCYQENGKTVTIYIGKELPKELKRLINKRYKKPGYRNYTWPRPRG